MVSFVFIDTVVYVWNVKKAISAHFPQSRPVQSNQRTLMHFSSWQRHRKLYPLNPKQADLSNIEFHFMALLVAESTQQQVYINFFTRPTKFTSPLQHCHGNMLTQKALAIYLRILRSARVMLLLCFHFVAHFNVSIRSTMPNFRSHCSQHGWVQSSFQRSFLLVVFLGSPSLLNSFLGFHTQLRICCANLMKTFK